MNWQKRGLCTEVDPELFFPIGTTGPALLQIKEAKDVCAACPVLATCREWVLERNDTMQGVCGGLSEDEIVSERRKRQRAKLKARRMEEAQ